MASNSERRKYFEAPSRPQKSQLGAQKC